MDEIIISYNGTLYALIPRLESQRWNSGVLKDAPYSGLWWQMDAVDSDGNEYILCWFDESIDEDDDGCVSVDLYKPNFIQCTFSVEE